MDQLTLDKTPDDIPNKKSGTKQLQRVGVLLPLPALGILDYSVPPGVRVNPGSMVTVPLSGRRVTGVVWNGGDGRLPLSKLKEVDQILPLPPLGDDLRGFVDFVSTYTMSNPGSVLRMVLSSPAALGEIPKKTLVVPQKDTADILGKIRQTPARKKVLEVLSSSGALPVSEIAKRAAVSEGVVRGLVDRGVFQAVKQSVDKPFPLPDPGSGLKAENGERTLRPEQANAARGLIAGLGGYTPILLEGVTGSGKTEVYFELIAEALKKPDVQILVLLPEIALTSQWLTRFSDRFGVAPAVWHSNIGDAGRRRAWREVLKGRAKVVVGARSALFLPFRSLAAIIVDEEHDQSFKQEEGVLYHGRDMAVVRAKMAGCPVVLASATPSLETRINAKTGKYRHVTLNERHGSAQLPEIKAVDMRAEKLDAHHFISHTLRDAITETLGRGEQVMLFLNRRGYAPLTICRTCGHRFQCHSCSAWLVEHRFQQSLQCHHCGFKRPPPRKCPSCNNEETLVPCGPGVERLWEEANNLFPSARQCVMASDAFSKPAEFSHLVHAIEAGHVDIIIGTQIMTKGYHFPKLTLVGVIDADLGLRGADLRAAERTYQQLTQVAGRAGREKRAGSVYLQTFDPTHPVTQALVTGDGSAFMALEERTRHLHHMPPFGKLVAIILSGPNENDVMAFGRELSAAAPAGDGIEVFGPAPAPLTRIRSQFRARLLVHAAKTVPVQKYVSSWIAKVRAVKGVRLKIDVDPYSFL